MPLTAHEIEEYKKRLLVLKAQLTQTVKVTTQEVKEQGSSKGYSQHQADEGTDDIVQIINLEVSSIDFEMIRQIDRALTKIEEGTYGICDITGAEIPKKRLDALPYATMTVAAQEKLEKGFPE